MPAALRVVSETGVCLFCWRTLPVEDLHEGEGEGGMFCDDMHACVAEFLVWEDSGGWAAHPAYVRMAS